jgi:polyferredoxin
MGIRPTTAKRILQLALLTAAFVLLIAGHLWADEEPARKQMGFFDILMLPRVWVGALFCLAGAVILMKARGNRALRVGFLPLIFFVFGVLTVLPLGQFARGMGLHPSPMCSITKPFLFVNAGRSIPVVFPAILFSIAVLSIAGNKLFCGWVCPIGALQELVHEVPLGGKLKFKLPFKVTNWIRVLLFVAFVPLVFLVGKSVYDYINPFETLHWGFEIYGLVVLGIVLVAALFVFRPFCYVVCPIGLFTWLLERISVVKVKVDSDKCITCYECSEKAPCPAMIDIVDGKKWRPDCFSCGKCLDTCTEDAISYKV